MEKAQKPQAEKGSLQTAHSLNPGSAGKQCLLPKTVFARPSGSGRSCSAPVPARGKGTCPCALPKSVN